MKLIFPYVSSGPGGQRQSSFTLEYRQTNLHSALNHIDSDGRYVLVGTETEMVLWDFSVRSRPSRVTSVPAGQVCCCVMSYPYAFCSGLFINYGVQVWNIVEGTKIR